MKLSHMDKGGLLALATVITVAALAVILPGTVDPYLAQYEPASQFGMIIGATMLPAVLVGALLGKIGASLHAPRRLRFAVMGSIATLAVLVFGLSTCIHPLIPIAALPTLAGTAALERWTRPRRLLGGAIRLG